MGGSTTARPAPHFAGEDTVSATENPWTHNDVTGDSYTASKIQPIDKSQWEDYGNAQGADQVIKRLTATGVSKLLPANPTRVLSVRYTAPENIPAGTVIAVPTPANLYDCTTWAYYFAADNVQYDYLGYFPSSHSSQTETKTVLAQSGSTAVQNFAFEMEDIE